MAGKYLWELLGNSGIRRDAGPLTSESSVNGRQDSAEPRVITSNILHTLWLICRH
jgi:hypothetical protein